jgi:hypothetical protein
MSQGLSYVYMGRDERVIKTVHAVKAEDEYYAKYYGKALCGLTPGRRGNGWMGYVYIPREVTCLRCLAAIAKMEGSEH